MLYESYATYKRRSMTIQCIHGDAARVNLIMLTLGKTFSFIYEGTDPVTANQKHICALHCSTEGSCPDVFASGRMLRAKLVPLEDLAGVIVRAILPLLARDKGCYNH